MKDRINWGAIRNFAIELVIYGLLVTVYALGVLRFLGHPLNRLFHSDLVVYAFVALGLIVVQGVALDAVTSFLLERLPLDRMD